MLAKLKEVHTECIFSDQALKLWEAYQRRNRSLLQTESDEAHLARLNGAPRHVQKVAMLFEVSVWVKQDGSLWDGVIHSPRLESAIVHVDHCLQTATWLDSMTEKATVRTLANVLLARIRRDFRFPQNIRGGWIWLTKTQLTAKYASQPNRPHSWKPDDLYLRLIPCLIELGMARLGEQQGKRVSYGFTVEE